MIDFDRRNFLISEKLASLFKECIQDCYGLPEKYLDESILNKWTDQDFIESYIVLLIKNNDLCNGFHKISSKINSSKLKAEWKNFVSNFISENLLFNSNSPFVIREIGYDDCCLEEN